MSARHFSAGDGASQHPSDRSETSSATAAERAQVHAPEPVTTDEKQVYGLVNKHGHRHRRKHRSTRGRKGARPVVGVVLALVFILLCVGAAWVSSLGRSMSMGEEHDALTAALTKTEKELADETIANDGFYVLLVGSDAREQETSGRGDVLMLARIDPTNAQVTLVSIPRDTMVSIAGALGTQKINATYAYGGASAAVYELSRFSGVPISHYAEIDFAGLERVVDMLGGVWVDVPEAVSLSHSGGYLAAGEQMLDGATALAYARERYSASGGDFGRAQAQRLIVQAIIRQVMQANPSELPGLIGSLASCVKTDYSVPDLVSLAMQLQGRTMTVYSAVCPSYALWQDGVSYVGTMYDEWRDMMRRVDAGLDPNDTGVEIPEPYASSERLGAALNAESPREYRDLAEGSLTTDAVAETGSVAEIG